MTAQERREEILNVLSVRRRVTARELSEKFGVTMRTIWNDVTLLSLSYPLSTRQGNGGGICVTNENWRQNQPRRYLTDAEEALLKRLLPGLQTADRATMESLLRAFAKPNL